MLNKSVNSLNSQFRSRRKNKGVETFKSHFSRKTPTEPSDGLDMVLRMPKGKKLLFGLLRCWENKGFIEMYENMQYNIIMPYPINVSMNLVRCDYEIKIKVVFT